SSGRGCHAPDDVGQIVGDDQGASRVHGHPDRAATRLAGTGAEVVDEVHRRARWPAIREGYENHLVAHRVLAVPAAMLANEDTIGILRAHRRAGEVQAQRRHVRAESVVRHDSRGDLFRVFGFDAGVNVLAPVAVGPAIEAAFLYRGEIVRYQVRPQFVTLVHHRPEHIRARLHGQRRGVAQAGGIGLVHAGLGIDLPDFRPVDLHVLAALGDVAVGADAHIQEAPVLTGGQCLGPVVVDRRGQVGNLLRRPAGLGLAFLVVEAHQGVLVGNVQIAVYQGQAVGGVEVLGKDHVFVGTVALGVAQQGQAVAALDRGGALGLDITGDHVLGFQGRRVAAPAFGHQDIAVGQYQGLPGNLQVGGDGGDGVPLGYARYLIAPECGFGNGHLRQQSALRLGELVNGAVGLLLVTFTAAGAQQHGD